MRLMLDITRRAQRIKHGVSRMKATLFAVASMTLLDCRSAALLNLAGNKLL
jgi:hypothetical protein